MLLNVDIKMPINLQVGQKFEFFVGSSMDYVSVHADGTITMRSSGGTNAVTYSINVTEFVRSHNKMVKEDK